MKRSGKRQTARCPQVAARKSLDAWRVAFAEFLSVPALIITGFVLLATATFVLDRSQADRLMPARQLLQAFVFADSAATACLLGTISAGLITITSITLSLLLISLQQSASALTHQVCDQFLRSWHNQMYFGVFVGLSEYALITLASVGPLNPVFGGAVALVLTILALGLLLALFYTTVDQKRPVMIIEAIRRRRGAGNHRLDWHLDGAIRPRSRRADDLQPARHPGTLVPGP